MTQIPINFDIPEVIDFKLRAVRRRLQLRQAAEGLLISLSALLVVMMLAMLIDELATLIETQWRSILTYTSLGIAGVVFVIAFIRPMLRPRQLSRVAGQIERRIPELEERWSTITELAESADPPSFRGSAALIEHVATEAVGLGWRVEPRDVVSYQHVKRWAVACSVCLAILLAGFLIAPQATSVLLQRFWLPTRSITQTHITSTTGSLAVPFGEPLLLEAQIAGRLRDHADLTVRENAGTEQHFELLPNASGTSAFRHRLPSIKQSFAYCWQSGDSRTQWYTVAAEHRPAVAQSTIKITPPAYSQLPDQELSPLPKQMRVLRGSQLDAAILPSKQLSHFGLLLGKGLTEALSADSNNWYHYKTILNDNLILSPRLQDLHGLANLAPPVCRIIVYEDEPPKVEIISPEDELVVNPDDTVKIEFKASDDFGIAEAELLVNVQEGNQEDTKVVPIPLENTKDAKKIHQTATLDLKSLQLKEGTELTYAVRVRDRRAATSMARPSPSTHQPSASQPSMAATDTRPSDEQTSTKPAEALADQKENSSSTQPSASCKTGEGLAQSKKPQKKEDQGQPGSKPPPNDMTSRMLDKEGTCCSKKLRLRVQEWSGSFEGQARKKLQIALTEYINRLSEALHQADQNVAPLVVYARAGMPWNDPQATNATLAMQQLIAAAQVVQELKDKSANTPYAYVGFQLSDIDIGHITPARRYLAEGIRLQADQAGRLKEFEQSSFHIARARELLAAMQAKFEADKKAEQQAESVKQLEKMHQLFVEDMAILLKACLPMLNPRDGKWKLIPDALAAQILKTLQERMDRKKRLLEALGKVLADDPDLLRRFMANSRKSAHTLRDQLTLLARRQIVVRSLWDAWQAADPDKRKELLNQYQESLMAQQAELVSLAGQFSDNVVIWVPRGLDTKQEPLARCIELSRELAPLSRQTQPAEANASIPPQLQWSNQTMQMLVKMDDAINDVANLDEHNDKLQAYVARRRVELGTLTAQHHDWADKWKALSEGQYERVVHVDQKHLLADTEAFRTKMKGLAATLGQCYTTDIGKKTDELAEVIEKDVNKHQVAACLALRKSEWVSAQQMEANAVAGFVKAEKVFDEMLSAVEAYVAAQPFQDPTTAPAPPSLEDQLAKLLKCLEQEGDACEKLGAVVHSNIMVQGDWMSPGEGSGSGIGNGDGAGEGSGGKAEGKGGEKEGKDGEAFGKSPGSGSGKPQKLPPELQAAFAELKAKQDEAKDALAAASKEQENNKPQSGSQAQGKSKSTEKSGSGHGLGKPGDIATGVRDERDWNVFISKLEDELKQGHANVPPEQYRQPIADYFQSISEAVSKASTRPSTDQ